MTTPPTIIATNNSVASTQILALASIFSVTGTVTSYNVYLDSPNDGTVVGDVPVIPGVTTPIAAIQFDDYVFIGGFAAGNDTLWLQAVDGSLTSNWVAATLTDTGAVAAHNQSVAYNMGVALSTIFSVTGTVTSYNVYLASPNDGTVTGGGLTITPGVVTAIGAVPLDLAFVGGGTPGSDQLWVQPIDGSQVGTWTEAVLTEPGATPDTVTAQPNSVGYQVTREFSSLFSVSGNMPTQYQVWIDGPSDGSVIDTNGVIATNTAVTEPSLTDVIFFGGFAAGTDTVYLRAFDGQWSNWTPDTLTDYGVLFANNQSVAYNQSVPLGNIFDAEDNPLTGYNVYLAGPNDGTVTGGPTITAGVTTLVTQPQFVDMNYVGSAFAGSDQLWVQPVAGSQLGTWTEAVLTDPGVMPDTVTAHPVSVGYQVTREFSSLFSVSGNMPTQYQVWIDGPSDGSVIDTNGVIATNTAVTEPSLTDVIFFGGFAAGTDTVYLRAFDGQWSNWTPDTLTDYGVLFANNQSVAYNQSVPLGNIFDAEDNPLTGYNVYLAGPNDGTVTGGPTITPGITTFATAVQFAAMSFKGGLADGSDQLWAQAVEGSQVGTWTEAMLTDTGAVTAHNENIVSGVSVPLSTIFTVAGAPITGYNVYLAGPNDGTVTGGPHITPNTTISATPAQFAAMSFVGGAVTATDHLWVQAVNGSQVGTWTDALLFNIALDGPLFAGSSINGAPNGDTLVYTDESNQTFLDSASVYNDTVVGFSEASGDRIHLVTDTASDALAHSTQVNGGADTLITLSDTSTILLKGVTHIDSGVFA